MFEDEYQARDAMIMLPVVAGDAIGHGAADIGADEGGDEDDALGAGAETVKTREGHV